jgi:hypothetical protein
VPVLGTPAAQTDSKPGDFVDESVEPPHDVEGVPAGATAPLRSIAGEVLNPPPATMVGGQSGARSGCTGDGERAQLALPHQPRQGFDCAEHHSVLAANEPCRAFNYARLS